MRYVSNHVETSVDSPSFHLDSARVMSHETRPGRPTFSPRAGDGPGPRVDSRKWGISPVNQW